MCILSAQKYICPVVLRYISRPAASISPGNLLKYGLLRPFPRAIKSEPGEAQQSALLTEAIGSYEFKNHITSLCPPFIFSTLYFIRYWQNPYFAGSRGKAGFSLSCGCLTRVFLIIKQIGIGHTHTFVQNSCTHSELVLALCSLV